MKIKTAFVSNSSSASIVIKWKDEKHIKNTNITAEQSLNDLFQWDYQQEDMVENLSKTTYRNKDESYRTIGGTLIMNCYGDFSFQIERLISYLSMAKAHKNSRFNLTSIRIYDEN
jgi:hypothetical protein